MKLALKKFIYNIYTSVLVIRNQIYDLYNKDTINILSVEETVEHLIENKNLSICRFGDGEFMLMFGKDIKFQKQSQELAENLKEIISSNEEKMMIGLPDLFNFNHNYTKQTNKYWLRTMAHYKYRIFNLTDRNQVYGNAFISRPYMNWKNKITSVDRFTNLFKLWENMNVLVVEGTGTRMGVGNDAFFSTSSVKRIIVPAEDAYEKRDLILKSIISNYNDELILIAAGPTANVLVYELQKMNIRAIDIGHFDLEYEWHLQNAPKKVTIDGKYTSEVRGGENFESEVDKIYESQIIEVIK